MATQAKTTKKSKFEQNLVKKLNAEKDQDAIAERAYRKASNIVSQQISALEVKRVDLQIELEERQEVLTDAQFCENFNIKDYDVARNSLTNVEEELADVEKTLEQRRELLASWK
jgi:hypothetical protein